METPIIIAVVAAVLGSNGLWMLIQSRLARKDAKEDKTDKIIEAIKDLRTQVEGIGSRVDRNAAVLARTHVLRFNDELMNGTQHSQEYFRQQLQDIDTYERYCDKHEDFQNSYAVMAIENIKSTYRKLMEKGEFSV
jgi:hypothetical protein